MNNWMLIALVLAALSSMACSPGMQEMRRDMNRMEHKLTDMETDLARKDAELQEERSKNRNYDRIAAEAQTWDEPAEAAKPLTPRPVAQAQQQFPGPMGIRYGTNAIMPDPMMCRIPLLPNVAHYGVGPHKVDCSGNCVRIRARKSRNYGRDKMPKYVALEVDKNGVLMCSGGRPLRSTYALVPKPGTPVGLAEGFASIGERPAINDKEGELITLYVGPGRHDLRITYFNQNYSGLFEAVMQEYVPINPSNGAGLLIGGNANPLDKK